MGPHRQAAGGVDDVDRLLHRRPLARDVAGRARDEVGGEQRVAAVDPLGPQPLRIGRMGEQRVGDVRAAGRRAAAERLVVELRDKLKTAAWAPKAQGAQVPLAGTGALVSALVNLGYKPAAAERTAEAVRRSLGPAAAVEDQLREALRLIAGAP
jgi:Holliday junction DNA helicase RuvA